MKPPAKSQAKPQARIAIETIRLLHVEREVGGAIEPVGRLAFREGRTYFEYEPAFLRQGRSISPFHLPLVPGVVEGRREPFDGLHGVFNDSLPDGWGRLLLDRTLSTHGILPSSLTPLDRLAWIGARGMGSLRYRPEHLEGNRDGRRIVDLKELDRFADEAKMVMEGGSEQLMGALSDLFELGSSSGGARPKVLLGCDKRRKKLIHGVDKLPSGYQHWLVKFPSSTDPIDVGAVEYAYSNMARAAGVDMSSTHLFPSKKGPGHFGTERFDRRHDERIHAHTLCGLLYADHRLPSIGYETLLKATRALTKSQVEVERVFRRMVFNVFARNRDDHTKNHSFLLADDGTWSASPAYDITFSSGPGGEHSLDIAGEGRAPGVKHISWVAEAAGVSLVFAAGCIEESKQAVNGWPAFAAEAGVSVALAKTIDLELNGVRTRRRAKALPGAMKGAKAPGRRGAQSRR